MNEASSRFFSHRKKPYSAYVSTVETALFVFLFFWFFLFLFFLFSFRHHDC